MNNYQTNFIPGEELRKVYEEFKKNFPEIALELNDVLYETIYKILIEHNCPDSQIRLRLKSSLEGLSQDAEKLKWRINPQLNNPEEKG